MSLYLMWLTLLWRRPSSYRNQSVDLLCKSMNWFLYDNGPRHERVKRDKENIDNGPCWLCNSSQFIFFIFESRSWKFYLFAYKSMPLLFQNKLNPLFRNAVKRSESILKSCSICCVSDPFTTLRRKGLNTSVSNALSSQNILP